jgi:hypothetical protein
MKGRIFEAGHTTAPDHMPERAKNRLHPRGRPHTYGPAAPPPRRPAARSVGQIVSALDSGHYGAVDDASDEAALDGRGEAGDLPSDDGAERFCCAGRAALRNEREHDLQMAARSSVYA